MGLGKDSKSKAIYPHFVDKGGGGGAKPVERRGGGGGVLKCREAIGGSSHVDKKMP